MAAFTTPPAPGILTLRILTPAGTLFEGTADKVRLPGALAPFTVLPGHCPLLTTLEAGAVEVVTAQGTEAFPVTGGFARIEADGVTLCVDPPAHTPSNA